MAARLALKTVPYRVTVALATGMATSKPGAEALLAAIKAGEASPRLLQEKGVIERLPVRRMAAGDSFLTGTPTPPGPTGPCSVWPS